MTDIVLELVVVEDEIGAEFVDGVVGEMHSGVVVIFGVGLFIAAGGQSAESL